MIPPSERYELKFIFDEAKLSQAMGWIDTYTSLRSAFPPRKVNSLYFDDISYQSVRDNLAGIPHRKKTRLRWYGDTSTGQTSGLVLELKVKNGRLGHKKTFPITNTTDLRTIKLADMSAFVESNLDPNSNTSGIFNDYLFPTLFVEYSRKYYEDNEGIRVTIDNAIAFHNPIPSRPMLEGSKARYPLYIMEIKFPPNMKHRVANLLRPLNFTPKRHSKYLTGLSNFGVTSYI